MLRRGAYYALIISGQNNALFVSFRLLRFAEKSAIIIADNKMKVEAKTDEENRNRNTCPC